MRTQYSLTRREAMLAALAVGAAGRRAAAEPAPRPMIRGRRWPRRSSTSRPIADGGAILAIEAPYRAEDAAVVPVTIRIMPAGRPAHEPSNTLLW